MSTAKLTIAICAKDAQATIERAIASIKPETHCRWLLINDHSSDNTVELAKAIAGEQLEVIDVIEGSGVGAARQTGLMNISTPYAAWLDADDEWIEGRADRIIEALDEGYDVYSDPILLYRGTDSSFTRELIVPSFIKPLENPTRLFERNYLPCDTQVGLRVQNFRDAGGYDCTMTRAESFDMILRVIAKTNPRFCYSDKPGYKMYAYPNSLSRNIAAQRTMLTTVLKKHSYEDIFTLLCANGYNDRVARWILVSMALYREEPEVALQLIEKACPENADTNEILEPDGPFPYYEGWRRNFAKGTCLLLANAAPQQASALLKTAETIEPTAETANNLGVALWRDGDTQGAQKAWQSAQDRLNGYMDPCINLELTKEGKAPTRITTHPMRREPSRSEYCPQQIAKLKS